MAPGSVWLAWTRAMTARGGRADGMLRAGREAFGPALKRACDKVASREGVGGGPRCPGLLPRAPRPIAPQIGQSRSWPFLGAPQPPEAESTHTSGPGSDPER